MSQLPLVIVNPASASGATGRAWPRIASDLARHFGPFRVHFTGRRGEGVGIARREAERGRALIIACGGDGTIHEVANGILLSGRDAELGLLPSGTGGDFRRTLEIPKRTADAARLLREGRARKMDAGRVTFTDDAGAAQTIYFLNVASFGMGGEVIRRVKESASSSLIPGGGARALGGKAAFAIAALRATLAFEKPAARIRIDGGAEFTMTLANFCVANARYFGGGMKVAPEARLDDGLLDVVAIGDLSAADILVNSYRLYLGTHLGLRDVGHAHARRVSARPADGEEVQLEVDGELVGRLPATFEIVPGALRVRCA